MVLRSETHPGLSGECGAHVLALGGGGRPSSIWHFALGSWAACQGRKGFADEEGGVGSGVPLRHEDEGWGGAGAEIRPPPPGWPRGSQAKTEYGGSEGPGQQWVHSGTGSQGWGSYWHLAPPRRVWGGIGWHPALFSGVSPGRPHLGGGRPTAPLSDWIWREGRERQVEPHKRPGALNLPGFPTSPPTLFPPVPCLQGETHVQTGMAAACTHARRSGGLPTVSAMWAIG